ncbi:50S ribosomal protein L19 [Candidatus Saccharibacteria bacterium]|jgi:large subunit ribosomal protein L19|nr:50S ribosomal protein L19 [Candidatus Saccharibacteria bacterium]
MSYELIKKVSDSSKKHQVVDVRSGDTVKVYQKIKEGSKTRTQMFEGVVIRVDRKNSVTARITVRKITSGVGVEKSYLLHSPLVEKIIITKRGKVRRNYLTYLRGRTGKSARLVGKDFDKSINDIEEAPAPTEEKPEVENQAEAGQVEVAEKSEEVVAAEEKTAETKVEETENVTTKSEEA